MKLFDALKNFFSKFFKKAVQEQLDIIIPVARDAIRQIESDPSLLTSDAKRTAAIGIILAELAVKEISYANRLVNLAIEIAVVELKGIE